MTVDLQRLNVKLYLEPGCLLSPEETFRVFSQWIPESEDEVLIDVADYSHIDRGPWTVLIGHDANYVLDNTDGRPGLLYGRKTDTNGPAADRLRNAFSSALKACRRLEVHPDLSGRARFRGSEALLVVNDRLRAPNTEETLEALRPDLDEFLARLYPGGPRRVQRDSDERERLTLRIEARDVLPVCSLLDRLGD